MEIKLNYTKVGIEVQVGKSFLPGVFLSDIAAHKAADRYINKIKEDVIRRRNEKKTK